MTDKNTDEYRERVAKAMEHRKTTIEVLKPEWESIRLFGGRHREWVVHCGLATARLIIQRQEEMERRGGMAEMLRQIPGCAFKFSLAPTLVRVPMPPDWKGVRPAECSEYGHPASAFKDWRHFENAIRYQCAVDGYLMEYPKDHDDRTSLCFRVVRFADALRMGLDDIKTEHIPKEETDLSPFYPPYPDDAFSTEPIEFGSGIPAEEPTAGCGTPADEGILCDICKGGVAEKYTVDGICQKCWGMCPHCKFPMTDAICGKTYDDCECEHKTSDDWAENDWKCIGCGWE